MKTFIKYLLQNIFGYQRYLYFFSLFKIFTIKWDKKENDFLLFLKLIRDENGILLDIGANIGIMSVLMSKSKPNSKIISFEPIPSNITVFKRVIKKFQLKNIELIESALGEYNGIANMILPKRNNVYFQGLSYVLKNNSKEINIGKNYEVKMTTLDCLSFEKKILAIKIDVENYEYEVFKGSIKTISEHKPIIYCELWENENRLNCIELLNNLDYITYCFINKKLTRFENKIHRTQNFIFIHKNSFI